MAMGSLLGRLFLLIVYTDKLVHVAFFSFVVDLDVLMNLAQCEAGKAF
jgi:hypothetical protein